MSTVAPNGASSPLMGETLTQLDEILRSPSFAASKRCQEFLRYVVQETIEGRGDLIKERVIAQEVFGRGSHFEPGEDSLVRVKAREVRKRLTEYYASAPQSRVKIELPLGGYVPRFESWHEPPDQKPGAPTTIPANPEPQPISRRRLLWITAGSVAAAGSAALVPPLFRPASPLDLFWRPIFATKTPLLIFIPVLLQSGELTDRVGIGTAAAVSRASRFLTKRGQPYHLRFGADMTFSQLREQPSLLLGGFSSNWTLRMTSGLRFNLVRNENGLDGGFILDRQTNRTWGPITPKNGYADQDYAILCRLFDSASGQTILVAAGITTFGTEAAAAVFFNPELFSSLLAHAPKDWQSKNFQAVIHLSIIGTTPSSPRFIATYFW